MDSQRHPLSLEWMSDRCFFLRGRRLSNARRRYLRKIFRAMERPGRIVLATARQVEKTTLALKLIVWLLITREARVILFVTPRKEQWKRFIRSYLMPILKDSPLLRAVLLPDGPRPKSHFVFKNGGEIIFESAYFNADSIRGSSVDVVLIDELQDLAAGAVPVIEECTSHRPAPRFIYLGTSKLRGNALQVAFERGTANIWHVTCRACAEQMPVDDAIVGAAGYCCVQCQATVDPQSGQWIESNPGSSYGESFRINQLLVPWQTHARILEKKINFFRDAYQNEVLGEVVDVGDAILSMDELRACCTELPSARSAEDVPPHLAGREVVIGVDWGSTARAETVMCAITRGADLRVNVLRWGRIPAGMDSQVVTERVAQFCREMRGQIIAGDGLGNGAVMMSNLFAALKPQLAVSVIYTTGGSEHSEGYGDRRSIYSVPRRSAIGSVIHQVQTKTIRFPRAEDCEEYFQQISSVCIEGDNDNRQIRFVPSPHVRDDALHALVYACAVMNKRAFKRHFAL